MDHAAFAPELGPMARFFLPRKNIHDRRGAVAGAELDHLRRVLRLKPGDPITLFDDAGSEHEAVIRSLSAEQCDVEILRSYDAQRESSLELILAVGLTKGEKMDFVVEKATELGVRMIAPFVSSYTVPRLDEAKISRRAARWQKIALSAAKQCGRTRIPEILALTEFQTLVSQPWFDTLKLFFWENESQQTLSHIQAAQPEVRSVLLVIGPEGGFSDQEANLAKERGFQSVALGRRTLRAETAAVAVMAVAQFIWGDLK
jgi:16S rRNA (uracil1498-N3)-methyltransferase